MPKAIKVVLIGFGVMIATGVAAGYALTKIREKTGDKDKTNNNQEVVDYKLPDGNWKFSKNVIVDEYVAIVETVSNNVVFRFRPDSDQETLYNIMSAVHIVENRMPTIKNGYVFDNYYWSDGSLFDRYENLYLQVTDHFTMAVPDKSVRYFYDDKSQGLGKTNHDVTLHVDNVYFLYMNFVPISYKQGNIAYYDMNGVSMNVKPIKYDCTSDKLLPTPQKPFYKFLHWEEVDTHEIIDYLPIDSPIDLKIKPIFEPISYHVNYINDYFISHSNPSEISYDPNGYTLKNATAATANFIGWYDSPTGGNKVTKINFTDETKTEINLYARYSNTGSYKVTYYDNVRNIKVKEQTFTANTAYQVVAPEQPTYNGQIGVWDNLNMTSLKDYTVNLNYSDQYFTARFITDIPGFEGINIRGKYGDKLYDLASQIMHPDRTITLLCKDKNKSQTYGVNERLYSDTEIYAFSENIIRISNYEQFMRIYDEPTKNFRITNEIDFKGATLRSIPEFSGTLDGGNFYLRNFHIADSITDNRYGLFKVNKGTISNLYLFNGTYNVTLKTSVNNTFEVGILCGVNEGVIDHCNLYNISPLALTLESISKDYSLTNTCNIGGFVGNNKGTIKNSVFNITQLKAEVKQSFTCYQPVGTSNKTNDHLNVNYALYAGVNSGLIEQNSIISSSIYLKVSPTARMNGVYNTGDGTYVINYGGFVGLNSGTFGTQKTGSSYAMKDVEVDTPSGPGINLSVTINQNDPIGKQQ